MFDLSFLIQLCIFFTFVHILAVITHFFLIYYDFMNINSKYKNFNTTNKE